MDRKFANRFLTKLSKRFDLCKRNRAAYRLIGKNGLYVAICLIFQGSNWCKGEFYCWKCIQCLFFPYYMPDIKIPLGIGGSRIHTPENHERWSEDEFTLEEEYVMNIYGNFLHDNSSLDLIYSNILSSNKDFDSFYDVYALQDAMYIAVVLGRFSDAKILAERVLSWKEDPYDWFVYAQTNAKKVLKNIENGTTDVLLDWLKEVQAKAIEDMKIKLPQQ